MVMQTQANQTQPSPSSQSWENMINRDLPYDEMRREYVAELVARRTQLEATQETEKDPNERIRLRAALLDLQTELEWMWKWVPDLAPAIPEPKARVMDQIEQALAAQGSSMRAWCRTQKTSRSRVASALRGNETSDYTQLMARRLLAQLGLEGTITLAGTDSTPIKGK